jgi:hypothetical protein
VYRRSFKEEFSSGFCCDILLAGHHNGHFRESVDDHKNTVITMLSIRKAQNIIHGDGFPSLTSGRQWNIEALLLDGQFGNGTSSSGLDVLPHILSRFRPMEILLQYCQGFIDPEIPNNPTIVRLPNHPGMLA